MQLYLKPHADVPETALLRLLLLPLLLRETGLSTVRRGNREEEAVMQRARKGEGEAPGSVRSHVRAEGSALSACYPNGGAVMKAVFCAAG